MNQKVSVTGLQNIGMLMARNEGAVAKPVHKVDAQHAIAAKTCTNLLNLVPPANRQEFYKDVLKFVHAAVREAYNAGHAEAFGQTQAVEALLDKQYKARTNLTMQAVVAAVMEQTGMSTLSLDLNAVATVFDRCKIHYDVDKIVADDLDNQAVHYQLHFNADQVQA